MNILETLLLGTALSMDAVAASVALGVINHHRVTVQKILLTAFLFGLFQALMPLLGWLGGNLCNEFLENYGRIIACILLCLIGAKMIYDSFKKDTDDEDEVPQLAFTALLSLAVATSIDALFVGVGFACLNKSGILPEITVIGITTFLLSAAGALIGRF